MGLLTPSCDPKGFLLTSFAAPLVLDAPRFHLTASDPLPRTAVFDCDGTLWSGDAGSGFKVWSIKAGLVSAELTDWIDERYRLYNRGEVSELAICGEMVQMYEGQHESTMREAADAFVQEYVLPRVFPEMARLVQALREADVAIWAVSSTNNWVIESGVRAMGIPADRVLAATVRVAGGRVTNELVDVPTDEGKATALRRVGISTPDAVFGNSIHDAAMLAMAARPFAVNPTGALQQTAVESGWPVFWPQGTLASRDGSSS